MRLIAGFLDSDEDDDESEEERPARTAQERAEERAKIDEKVRTELRRISELKKPKHTWNSVIEITKR